MDKRPSRELLSIIISVLLHPLMMPTIFFGAIFLFSPVILNPLTEEGKEKLVLAIFLTTFLIPVLAIITITFLTRKDITFEAIMMNKRKDRVVPMIFTGGYFACLAYFVFPASRHPVIFLVLMTIAAAVILAGLFSLFWKVSAHAIGIGGVTGFFVAVSYVFPFGNSLLIPILVTILLSGVLFSARLYLKAHTPGQILGGYLIGFSLCAGSILYCLKYLNALYMF